MNQTETQQPRWVCTGFNPVAGVIIRCTSCKAGQYHKAGNNPKFCPECGAKMSNWDDMTPPGFFQALDSF